MRGCLRRFASIFVRELCGYFFFQAEDGIRDLTVTGVQTCALPISAPEGTRDPQSAARAVREMFTSIAPRYDLLNHVLSFNVDRLWWRRAARTFTHILRRTDAKILDLCCGTGDMTFALDRRAGGSEPLILGADFS